MPGQSLLQRFWFAPAPPLRLALLRLLIGGFTLWLLASRWEMYTTVASSRADLFEPVGVARLLSQPLPPALFQVILLATIGANVLFLLGWRFVITGPLFAGLFLWTMCYRNSWSMIFHMDNLAVLHVIVLALSPCADALALDARRTRQAQRAGAGTWPATSDGSDWRYGWPVRLMCTLTVLTYFLAGFAKVSGEWGWSWASGDSLQAQLARDGLRKELLGEGAPRLVFLLYEHHAILTAVAVTALILELGAPLALLERRAGWIWAAGAWGMHWGILFIMGITFRYQLAGIVFLSFFPLERLLPLRRTTMTACEPALLAVRRTR